MALSGSFVGGIRSDHYRLKVEWSGSQNIENNTTTITAKMYFENDSGWTINFSADKTGSTTVDDSAQSWTYTGGASGSGLKILLATKTFPVIHNTDGTKSLTMSSIFNIKVTLSGTYYESITANSGTVTLDTIPRKSTLTSNANWMAGSNTTLSISRHSTSFRHEAEMYVKRSDGVYDWVNRVDFSTSETSKSTSFSTTAHEEIFQHLAGRSSADTKIVLQTFNGSTIIGSNEYYGTVTVPTASTFSSSYDGDFYVDETMSFPISRKNSAFTHTLKIYIGSNDPATATLVKTITGVGTSASWTPTAEEKTTMYNAMPNHNVKDGHVQIFTYYGSQLVRSRVDKDIDFYVRNSNPTFGTGYTYRDNNATTSGITSNDQYIIQNQSTVLVEITAVNKASANNGATMVEYVATLNGVEVKQPWSSTATVSFNFGSLNVNSNATLSIKAIDSRGNSTTTTKTITIVPYSPPTVQASATRLNNYEATTTITLNGSLSLISVGGVTKNTLSFTQYRVKETTTATWGAWTTITSTFNTTNGTYSGTDVSLTLDNTKSFNLEVRTQDSLQTSTVSKMVDKGQPIFFIDDVKKAVGVNKMPTRSNVLEIEGDIFLSGRINNQDSGNTESNFLERNSASYPALYVVQTGATSTEITRFCHPTHSNAKVIVYTDGVVKLNGISFANNSGSFFDDYGNLVAKSTVTAGAYWNIRNYQGERLLEVPWGSNGGAIKSLVNFQIETGLLKGIEGAYIVEQQKNTYGKSTIFGASGSGAALVAGEGRANNRTRYLADAEDAYLVGGVHAFIEANADNTDTPYTAQLSGTDGTFTVPKGLVTSGDIDFNGNMLIANYLSTTNIDHIWYDDGGNVWHFCADVSAKSDGNATLRAGTFQTSSGDAYINGTGGGTLSSGTTLIAGGIRTQSFNSNLWLGTGSVGGGEIRATDFNGYNSGGTITYRPVKCLSVTETSSETIKQDIELWKGSALDILNSSDIYQYQIKDDVKNGIEYTRYGFVIGEGYRTPKEVISHDGDAVDQYIMTSIAIKAIQELSKEVERLEMKLDRR